MSHIVTIRCKCTDRMALASTCQRLQLAPPTTGSVNFLDEQHQGILIRLPDWIYPIVINTTSGDIHYDNYNGCWGDPAKLNSFVQRYAVEKAKIEARKKGYQTREINKTDGSIDLEITLK